MLTTIKVILICIAVISGANSWLFLRRYGYTLAKIHGREDEWCSHKRNDSGSNKYDLEILREIIHNKGKPEIINEDIDGTIQLMAYKCYVSLIVAVVSIAILIMIIGMM